MSNENDNINDQNQAPYNPNYEPNAPPFYSGPPQIGFQAPYMINCNPNISIPINVNVKNNSNRVDETSIFTILEDKQQLMIKQSISIFKIFGIQCNNIYNIEEVALSDHENKHLFTAHETSNICKLNFTGPTRNFKMLCREPRGTTILEFYKGRSCFEDFCRVGCFDSCRDEILMNVSTKGRHIGSISNKCCKPLCFPPQLSVTNRLGGPAYKLGRACACSFTFCGISCLKCCKENELPILDATGTQQVGQIIRKRGTLLREIFTDSNDFYIKFPDNADPEIKGVLIGAVILWDFQNFERRPFVQFISIIFVLLYIFSTVFNK